MSDTWLTPYLDAWEQAQGAIAPGRLAKAVKPAHDLLGDGGPSAFALFAASGDKLRPEWFAPNCRAWATKVAATMVPLVNTYGTLTDAGKQAYGGMK